MPSISEQLGSPAVVTPELQAALAAAQIHDAAMRMLIYQCDTCTGQFDESTVEAVLARAGGQHPRAGHHADPRVGRRQGGVGIAVGRRARARRGRGPGAVRLPKARSAIIGGS